jgi:two-component system sensor histidine kinase MprB
MGLAAGVAVALAVVAVAVSAYAGTRSDLRGQVDSSLRGLLAGKLGPAGTGPGGPGGPGGGDSGYDGPPPFAPAGGGFPTGRRGDDVDEGLQLGEGGGPSFGGAPGIVALVYANGHVYVPAGQRARIPVSAAAKALAASNSYKRSLSDIHVNGIHLRVLTAGIGPRGALLVALPLTDVDHTLSHELLLIVLIAAGGIALAALLGLLVARTAIAPITRFTRQTEEIAANPARLDSQRLDVSGRDELARLGRTFNATLDALGRSIESQRNLVADASHELRTPIASIRANLQLLRDEERLSDADRTALRHDMIEELDELTALVGDVVELARGAKPSAAYGDVRLDEIVSSLAERAQRRSPELTITCSVEPAIVRGESDRIARAVANLLDNARKWSPAQAVIDVVQRGGEVSVRDHGPGFHAEDLSFIFDRFHRAKDARSKPGSGLGLAIVRQAAEAHGGKATAANAPGGGAIVTVSFGNASRVDDASDGGGAGGGDASASVSTAAVSTSRGSGQSA